MKEITDVLNLLKDPALVSMMVVIYLLIRQNGALVKMVDRNTKTLSELTVLINVLVSRGGK